MQIKMIGRLIQKQNIRFGKQKFSQRNTGSLPSGKGSDRLFKIFFCKSQSLQDSGDFTLIGIAVFPFKPGSQIVISGKPVLQMDPDKV